MPGLCQHCYYTLLQLSFAQKASNLPINDRSRYGTSFGVSSLPTRISRGAVQAKMMSNGGQHVAIF